MILDKEELKKFYDKQDQMEYKMNMLYIEKEKAYEAMYSAIKSMPTDAFSMIGFDTNTGFDGFSKLYEDKKKYNDLIKELSKVPQYKIMQKSVSDYDQAKYNYYLSFYDYVNLILKDRERLLDEDYILKIKELGEKGWFIYFLRTPDFPLFEKVDDSIHYLYHLYCSKNYEWLKRWILPLLNTKNGLQTTHDMKIDDLTEAINCMINGAYRSCARTLFALLENEHRLCSNLLPKARGLDRANKINENIVNLKVEYYYEAWEQMNEYFKIYNLDFTKNDIDELNRNELAHGEYKRKVTDKDCLKLIFLLASFKELTFVVRNKIEIEEEFGNDLRLYLLKEGKYEKNIT